MDKNTQPNPTLTEQQQTEAVQDGDAPPLNSARNAKENDNLMMLQTQQIDYNEKGASCKQCDISIKRTFEKIKSAW